jgi:hypothetical protein
VKPTTISQAATEFSIKLNKLENDRWVLSIENAAGEVVSPTDLTLDETMRMIRLKLVTLAYPMRYHDRLLH